MQKVITINLNGNAYQVDETGYAALVAYLEGAERQLKDNPDRAEIIADLEQAIAEKCRRFLSAHKSVVAAGEVDRILTEMGPVDGAPGSGDSAGGGGGAKAGAGSPKRLHLLREGAMLAGVCNGIAAYLHIDPTIVRIAFVVLAILTKGVFFFLYVVLALVIPPANTPEERAAAYGETFNAQELIDRAKRTYTGFKAGSRFGDWGRDWGRQWRRQERQWRRQFDRTMHSRWRSAAAVVPPAGYTARLVAGFMVPVLTIVSALLFWIGAYAMLSLVAEHQVFGVALPEDVPFWAGILFLVFLYQSAAWPLHAARRASYQALGGPHHAAIAALDGLLSVGIGIFIVWIAWQNMPEVRELLRSLPDLWDSMRS